MACRAFATTRPVQRFAARGPAPAGQRPSGTRRGRGVPQRGGAKRLRARDGGLRRADCARGSLRVPRAGGRNPREQPAKCTPRGGHPASARPRRAAAAKSADYEHRSRTRRYARQADRYVNTESTGIVSFANPLKMPDIAGHGRTWRDKLKRNTAERLRNRMRNGLRNKNG